MSDNNNNNKKKNRTILNRDHGGVLVLSSFVGGGKSTSTTSLSSLSNGIGGGDFATSTSTTTTTTKSSSSSSSWRWLDQMDLLLSVLGMAAVGASAAAASGGTGAAAATSAGCCWRIRTSRIVLMMASFLYFAYLIVLHRKLPTQQQQQQPPLSQAAAAAGGGSSLLLDTTPRLGGGGSSRSIVGASGGAISFGLSGIGFGSSGYYSRNGGGYSTNNNKNVIPHIHPGLENGEFMTPDKRAEHHAVQQQHQGSSSRSSRGVGNNNDDNTNNTNHGMVVELDHLDPLRYGYTSLQEMKNRPFRFPSIEDRVKVYMSNWYLPSCDDNVMDGKIQYKFRSTTTTTSSSSSASTTTGVVDTTNNNNNQTTTTTTTSLLVRELPTTNVDDTNNVVDVDQQQQQRRRVFMLRGDIELATIFFLQRDQLEECATIGIPSMPGYSSSSSSSSRSSSGGVDTTTTTNTEENNNNDNNNAATTVTADTSGGGVDGVVDGGGVGNYFCMDTMKYLVPALDEISSSSSSSSSSYGTTTTTAEVKEEEAGAAAAAKPITTTSSSTTISRTLTQQQQQQSSSISISSSQSIPTLLQFGDSENMKLYIPGSRTYGTNPNIPIIRKFRRAYNRESITAMTTAHCIRSKHDRIMTTIVHPKNTQQQQQQQQQNQQNNNKKKKSSSSHVGKLQPIIWKLTEKRHFGMLDEIPAADIPWNQKQNRAIWRGGLTGIHKAGFTNIQLDRLSSQEKCELMHRCKLVLQSNDSKLIDAKLVGKSKGSLPNIINNVELFGTKLNYNDMLQYKAIIMLEGNDISSGFKWAMYSRSVVMTTKPTLTSWAMEELLIPWIHYIPLADDLSDVEEKMIWILQNDFKAQQIAHRGSLWIKDLIYHPQAVYDDEIIYKEMMIRYQQHFIYDPNLFFFG